MAFKLKDVSLSKRFFGLFTGRSGDGKSVAGASFPRPLHIMDFDQRIRGVAAAHKIVGDFDKITFDNFDPYCGYTPINDELMKWQMAFRSGMRPFETLQISSLSTLSRVFMNEAKELLSGMIPEKEVSKGITKRSKLRLSGPADYKYLNQGMLEVLDILKSFPCNIIFDCHVVDKYGKDPNDDNDYAESVVIGEKLVISDKLGELILANFDEVYRFSRNQTGDKFYVEFHTDVAKSAYTCFEGGRNDITNKNFYQYWKEKVDTLAP